MPTFKFCKSCERYFEDDVKIHRLHCAASIQVKNEGQETVKSSTSVEGKLKCEFCSAVFLSDGEASDHQKKCKHETIRCEKCSSLVERCKMSEHTKKHCMRGSTKCYYCCIEITEAELKSHTSICDLSPIRCVQCEVLIPRRYMAHHLSVDCAKRFIQCEYCKCDMMANTLQEHFEVCNLIPVYCENKCGKEIKRKELEHHMNKECSKRRIKCKYCVKNVELELLENHYSECEGFPIPCPKACGKSVAREEVAKHMDEACEKSYAKCMYQAVSCSFEGLPVDLRKHIQDKNDFHAQITNNSIESLSRAVENQKVIIENQTVIITALERNLKETEEALQRRLKETEERVSELEESLMKMKQEKTPKVLTSGKYLWRIQDVRKNFKSFQFGTVLRSDTFYESEYGYNLQVELNPNGCSGADGEVYRDCLGIFVRICPGEYDSALDWPFQKRITFTLIDLRNRAYDVREHIENFESPSFQRPYYEVPNSGYGFPRFVNHGKVKRGNYIYDNMMFIEVQIE